MSIFHAYLNFWRKAFSFNGRAARREYWVPVILHGIIFWLLNPGGPIFAALSTKQPVPFSWHQGLHDGLLGILLIPTITLFARRLQDLNIDGRFSIIFFIFEVIELPIIFMSYFMKPTDAMMDMNLAVMTIIGLLGMVLILSKVVLALWPGNKGSNRFGPDPRDIIE